MIGMNKAMMGHYGKNASEIAQGFNLDLKNLKVEFFSPGHQGIFIERVGHSSFRVHVNIEENRIIAVEQIAGPAAMKQAGSSDPFAKYKNFMT